MTEINPSQEVSQSLNASPLVELRAMTLEFAKQVILNQINLQIPRGQTVAVIGESGCGKTMLLKTIVGLIKPTSGSVHFDGRNIHTLSDYELTQLRCKFGFVFQNAALFDSLTIGQNVAFPLVQHRLASDRQIDRIVSERLIEVGLPPNVSNKRPAQLSGGMRKRVGLARALVLQPELMLYDEPTTGLDPIMSDVINELMLRTRMSKRVTSLIVTHDMRTARKVADRVVMLYPYARLKKGESQIIYDGAPEGLDATSDKRVRQFVEGEAGERLMELTRNQPRGFDETPDVSARFSSI
ncbi:MAG: ATP-binding cassette domain-containing protein [Planctomycetales bacterium]|nr:ATP-binding cassette domain-containing protein [Planctomycetales bacterium]